MRRAWNVTRAADVDDGPRAGQRQPEVDLDGDGAIGDVALGRAARLLGIARDDRICRVGRTLAVDVRPGESHPWPSQTLGGEKRAQRLVLLDPLPRVAEAGDAVRKLPQRQLRIVLDVEVQVDEAWHQRATGQIQPLRAVRYFALSARLHALDAIAPDGHAHVVLRGPARTIDDPRMVQDRTAAAGRERRCFDSTEARDWRTRGLHTLQQ